MHMESEENAGVATKAAGAARTERAERPGAASGGFCCRRPVRRRPRKREDDAVSPEAREAGRASLSIAASLPSRMRGLLLAHPCDEALLLIPCSDVHTVGMRRRLDIAFVDGDGRVIESHRDVGAMRRLRNRRAVAVVERFSSCSSPWFAEGDRLGIACVEEVGA